MKVSLSVAFVAIVVTAAAALATSFDGTRTPAAVQPIVVITPPNVTTSSASAAPLAGDAAAATPTSDWAKLVNGVLAYKTTANGDRIIDFSTAGFSGGGVALPTGIPVRVTLSPSGGDDTNAIQAAIDMVSARDRGTDRYRGAIKFNPGTFKISRTINVNTTGVVLVGSGSGSGGTVIEMTGDTGFLAFQFGASQAPVLSNTVDLTSPYIRSGSISVPVSSATGFAVGQRVQMARKVTSAWISFMGMDHLVRDGQPQTWLTPGTTIDTPRAITAIDTATNVITFDGPITDSLDSNYLGSPVGTLSRAEYPGRVSWVGLQQVQIKAPAGTKVYPAVTMSNVINGYLSDVAGVNTQNAFNVSRDALQITFDKVVVSNSTTQTNAAPTADFSVNGSQVLLNKCSSLSKGNWAFATGTGVGPTVLLKFTTASGNRGVAPHQRWYTGLLVDSSSLPGSTSTTPGIAYTNRTTLGTGQGWTTGWSVAWNVTTPYVSVQAAPGTTNWCIGCVASNATSSPSGTFDSLGERVSPASLYLEQLQDRKGIAAVNAIGYPTTTP